MERVRKKEFIAHAVLAARLTISCIINVNHMRITRTDKIIISLVLIGVLATGAVGSIEQRLRVVPASLKPQITYQTPALGAAVNLQWPVSGQAAIGANGYGVLASNGAQTPVPTASIAKLITALAVLKVKPLAVGEQGPNLTIAQNDVDYYESYKALNGSVVKVVVGEQISEYQVLQAILLPSANNLADSLASWAFGSLPAYATYANQMLANYGLANTVVGLDASGLSPTTVSTASDLVRLGELALSNPVISLIASQSTATLPVVGTVKNVNWLLGTNGVNGLKTGNSDQAGGAFLLSANYAVGPGSSIIIVSAVMKAANLWQAMDSSLSLLTSAQKGFSLITAVAAGQVVGQYQVPWGGVVTALASQEVRALAWQGSVIDKPVISLDNLRAPIAQGDNAGNIRLSSSAASASPITLNQTIAKPSIWWRLSHNR